MTRFIAPVGLFVLSAMLFFSAGAHMVAAQGNAYRQPEIVKAGEVNYPIRSVAYGIVVLEVTVDARGEVEAVQGVRDVASLTPAAMQAVKKWKFSPAKLNGEPIRSKTTVAVVFSPRLNNPPNVVLPPLAAGREAESRSPRSSPPRVTKAAFPKYPIRSVAWGTVILQLQVDAGGDPEAVKTVRGIVSLTPEAARAAKEWKFQPAMFDGAPVRSTITAAFLFRPPIRSSR